MANETFIFRKHRPAVRAEARRTKVCQAAMSSTDEQIIIKAEDSARSSCSRPSASANSHTSQQIVIKKADRGGAVSDSDDDLPLLEVYKKHKRKIAESTKSSQSIGTSNASIAKKIKTEPPKAEAKIVKKEKREKRSKKEVEEEVEEDVEEEEGDEDEDVRERPVREPRESKSSSSNNSLSAEFYDKTTKGFLLQTFLCRWWYAVEWPEPSTLKKAPAGYEPLDGFPGVHIGTSQELLGQVLDLRDKTTMPSLKVRGR